MLVLLILNLGIIALLGIDFIYTKRTTMINTESSAARLRAAIAGTRAMFNDSVDAHAALARVECMMDLTPGHVEAQKPAQTRMDAGIGAACSGPSTSGAAAGNASIAKETHTAAGDRATVGAREAAQHQARADLAEGTGQADTRPLGDIITEGSTLVCTACGVTSPTAAVLAVAGAPLIAAQIGKIEDLIIALLIGISKGNRAKLQEDLVAELRALNEMGVQPSCDSKFRISASDLGPLQTRHFAAAEVLSVALRLTPSPEVPR